jgi:uncharacterized protein (UPF0261 family)
MPIAARAVAATQAMRSLLAMASARIRYAEARPSAAAIIAAGWSGGAIKTSFR